MVKTSPPLGSLHGPGGENGRKRLGGDALHGDHQHRSILDGRFFLENRRDLSGGKSPMIHEIYGNILAGSSHES